MTIMNVQQQTACLIGLGWPLDRFATGDGHLFWATVAFQEAAGIKVDGVWGDETQRAAFYAGASGGRVSAHHTAREFACKCWARGLHDGSFCRGWITVKRSLINALEAAEQHLGRGASAINSGYRCDAYNRWLYAQSHQKPTTDSRHIQGDACDPTLGASLDVVRRMAIFTGIGYQSRGGLVTHVDMRPGDPARPTVWAYA